MSATDASTLVNGRTVSLDCAATTTLAGFLRETLNLKGTKEGCNEGECGACTVLIDGRPVTSCIYPALAAEGRTIETIEGVGKGPDLSAIQEALLSSGGIQCGFCTPGFVMTLTALRREGGDLDDERAATALAGNICRCTGYSQILEAVLGLPDEGEQT